MRKIVTKSLTIVFSVLLSGYVVAADRTVMDVLKEQADYSTFVSYLEKTGLDSGLDLPLNWNWTVFAPTNSAFMNLNEEMQAGFKDDPQLLKNLLIDHLLVGSVQSDALNTTGKKTVTYTVSQKPIELYQDKDMYVKDMIVVDKDMEGSNGIIHGIACVMFVQKSVTDPRLSAEVQEKFPVTACCLNAGMHDDTWEQHYSNVVRSHSQ